MDLPINAFKAGLAAGRAQIGLWCAVPDSGQVELLAGCGFDWLMLDTEHAPVDAERLLPMLQGAAAYPVSTMARAASLNTAEIKKLLDIGAQTIMVPYVQDADEARQAAAAVAYPPQGVRGVAGAIRAARYGAVANYHAHARDEICLIVQIETRDAMERLEDIAAVEGIDAVFFGPADLAASFGLVGQPSHPEVKAAILTGIACAQAGGTPAGVLTMDPAFQQECLDAGAAFIGVDMDVTLLRRAAAATAQNWRAKAQEASE